MAIANVIAVRALPDEVLTVCYTANDMVGD